MTTRRELHKLFLLLTMPMVMWLFFNQVAYWHFHMLDNGVVVQHAHPYKNNPYTGTPYQKHQHSDFEYLVLAQLSLVAGILILLLYLGLYLTDSYSKIWNGHRPNHYLISINPGNPLRGPPAGF